MARVTIDAKPEKLPVDLDRTALLIIDRRDPHRPVLGATGGRLAAAPLEPSARMREGAVPVSSSPRMPPDPLPLLAKTPVIPVLTIEKVTDAVPLARALLAGGLSVIEVTLRTRAALDAIRAIAGEAPEVVVGAGTLTGPADVEAAVKAGAKYLVSPGTPAALLDSFVAAPVPAVPGCSTVSEAMTLAARGFAVLKFFPAEACGGIAWLKSAGAPLPHLRFCPTGGIDGKNAAAYLALPNVVAVGGSWVAPKEAIAAGDFSRVSELARAAAALRC